MTNKPLFVFFSSGMAKIQSLRYFFPEGALAYRSALMRFGLFFSPFYPSSFVQKQPDLAGILIWGKKSYFRITLKIAKKLGIPLVCIEDGFLRSVKPADPFPLSVVLDRQGIYYDASIPCELEQVLMQPLTDEQILRARSIEHLWRKQNLSKYNDAPNITQAQLSQYTQDKPFLLLIDQTVGDQSVKSGWASKSSFEKMLKSALEQQEIEKILIKTHPEVMSGKKTGYLTSSPLLRHPRISIIKQSVHLPSLLCQASALYTVTSQCGFEALLWDLPVHTFGMPFYAGWGLTIDHLTPPNRRKPISKEQLIYASLVSYPRYLDPETLELCAVENAMIYLGLQRKERERFEAPLLAPHFSKHKLHHLKRFTQGATWALAEQGLMQTIPTISLVWGTLNKPITLGSTSRQVQVEDGFIRSIGLGAMLAKPYSWVFDSTGMYYDATRPSDLELLLQNHHFSPSLLNRADQLQEMIVRLGLTKYNQVQLGLTENAQKLSYFTDTLQAGRIKGKKIALVIGQVETDASIRLGGIDLFTNEALLKEVRHLHPDALIVYKPHPDIVKGLRQLGTGSRINAEHYDVLAPDLSLALLLDSIDEVHTISSLSGLEALLRNKRVYCYGMPFYAGWGLTIDRHHCTRRTRCLSIPELVAGSLLLYPTYLHPLTNTYCTAESLIQTLAAMRDQESRLDLKWYSLPAFKYHLTFRFMKYYHQLKGI